MTSHLLPTYARANLAFERGEGAWLTATDGTRYLDFAAGVAVNVLGDAHPALVAAVTEQAQKLWHVSNFTAFASQRLANGSARRASRTPCSSAIPARGEGMRDQDRAQISRGERASGTHQASPRSKAPFTGARSRRSPPANRKNISKALARLSKALIRWRSAIDAVKRAVSDATAGIIIEPVMGEGGVRAVPPQFLKALRELCDQRGLLLVFDEVQTGIGRLVGVRLSTQRRDAGHHGACESAWRRVPDPGVSFDRGSRERHDRRHARLDLRRQSARHEGRQRGARRRACAGFLDNVRKTEILFNSGSRN